MNYQINNSNIHSNRQRVAQLSVALNLDKQNSQYQKRNSCNYQQLNQIVHNQNSIYTHPIRHYNEPEVFQIREHSIYQNNHSTFDNRKDDLYHNPKDQLYDNRKDQLYDNRKEQLYDNRNQSIYSNRKDSIYSNKKENIYSNNKENQDHIHSIVNNEVQDIQDNNIYKIRNLRYYESKNSIATNKSGLNNSAVLKDKNTPKQDPKLDSILQIKKQTSNYKKTKKGSVYMKTISLLDQESQESPFKIISIQKSNSIYNSNKKETDVVKNLADEFNRNVNVFELGEVQEQKKTRTTKIQKKKKRGQQKVVQKNRELIKQNQNMKQTIQQQQQLIEQLRKQISEITNHSLDTLQSIKQKYNCGHVDQCYQYRQYFLNKEDIEINYEKMVGQGGFGQVYQGTFKNHQLVAIKQTEINCNRQEIEDVLKEILMMCQINDKRIVEFKGVFIQQIDCKIQLFYVTELLHLDLRKVISNQIMLSFEQKKNILIQILKGLSYLHSQNYVHCDIKLQNIVFIDKEYKKIKLIDFGLSKQLIEKTRKTQQNGFSERYSAYEYLIENRVSMKSDIWSFGILMYELMNSRQAYKGLTGPQVVNLIANKTPFYSINLKSDIESVDDIIKGCLNYQYSDRPSIENIIDELKQL